MGISSWRRYLVACLVATLIFEAGAMAPASTVLGRAPDGPPREPAAVAIEGDERDLPTEVAPLEPPDGRVEVVDSRTDSSRTFDNGDGTFTTELYPFPIHYQPDQDAEWMPIEVGFAETDGAAAEAGLVASSTKAPVSVSVGANKRAGGFLELEADGQTYAVSLTAADASRAEVRSPTFVDERADWVDFLPGVDLRVIAGALGAKTFLMLDGPPAVPQWTFLIDAPGLTAELAEDGSVGLFDADKEQVARIPAPYAVDSSASEERGGGEMTDQVSLSVRPAGDHIELTVSVDKAWLAGATYPVYVDPTITLTTGSTTYGDAFVSTKYPTMNFADYVRPDSPFYHEHWLGQDPTDSSNVNKVLMRFDTSAMGDATIDLAKLDVYPYHQYYNAPTATTTWVNRITASWAENTVTESNQPGSSCPCTSASLVEGSKGYFTLTGLVQDWVDGTYSNYGVKLHENGNNGTYWKRLIGAEQGGSNVPHLVVTWHLPVATPSNPTAAEWTNSRALSWSYSDSGGAAQTHYQVQVDNNSDFSSVLSSSGTVTSASHTWSIPAGVTLTNGTTYYWRVKVKNGTGWSNWSSGASFKWDEADATYEPPGGDIVGGAITAANPIYYELGNGSVTIKIRGKDLHAGIRFTYLRLSNATDEMRVKHDWQTGGTHCDEFNTSTLVDATACAETYNSGGIREVTFTVIGLNQSASHDIQWYFTDFAGNVPESYQTTGKTLILDGTAPTGSITSPAANATVGGTVNVVGTASDTNFHQYTLEYGEGASPSSWTDIGSNPRTTPVTSGTLGSWDTTGLVDGQYTLRLRVYDKARITSGFTTVLRTVTVNNHISSPTEDRLYEGEVTIRGTASGTNFTGYTLHFGVGCSGPSSWTDIGANPRTVPVEDDVLGIWDTAGLEGPHTLRLVTSYSVGGPTTTSVCVTLGSSLGQQAQYRFESWDLGAGDTAAVNVATGNLVLTHPLVSLPYRGGNTLPLTLTYNSLATDDVGLGTGWQLDVQARLILNANSTVTYVGADGSRHLFTDPQTAGSITTYTRPDSLYATLEQDATPTPDVFTLTWRDGRIDTFGEVGSLGRLDRSEDRHGNGLDFGYDIGTGLLETITDPAARVVDLAWNGSGQLESVTDWAYVDGSGIVQATASGSRRTYRFFYDGSGQLVGWSDPLNTAGSCPSGGSHLTCLTYAGGLLSGMTKTQTVTTFSSGTLGTTTRPITTEIAYDDGRVATVTDPEQVAQSGPATTFTWEEPDRVVVARPTTTTAYELTAAADPFARVTSVLRYLDPSTPIEQRTVWDTEFPTEPASVTDNYGAVLSTPARTVTYDYVTASLGLLEKLVEPLTATDDRWTEYTYNANNDVTQVIVSAEGSATERTVTRYCYSSAASCPSADGLTMLAEIQGYVDGTGGSGAGLDDADTDVRTDYAYDVNGQRTSVTRHNRDGAGAVLDDREDRFTFDANGNLTAEIVNYANGTVTGGDDLTPNATSQARTDLTTAHAHDTAGNRISSADPRRAILAATGPPGADDFVTRWTFDALNRQIGETTPTTPGLASTQASTTTSYDELGLARSTTEFGGLVTASEFDRAGRTLRAFEDTDSTPAVTTSQATYAADGQLLTAKDQRQVASSTLGHTSYDYDGLGRQVAVTEAVGVAAESSTATGYDALDRRTAYTVGGQSTTYANDLGGRVTATDDGFTCTTEAFDFRDLATSTIRGKNGGDCSGTGEPSIAHTYDALGRLLRDEQDSLRPVDESFDAVGNRIQSAPITTDPGGTTTSTTAFDVNLLDEVVSESRTEDGVTRTTKTTFDPAGNPADRCRWDAGATVGGCFAVGTTPWSNPPAQVTSTVFDARNQGISMTDGTTGQTTIYSPDDDYQPTEVYLPTGTGTELQTLYTYDADRPRLASVLVRHCTLSTGHSCSSATTLGSSTYTYDGNDNRVMVAESPSGSTAVARYYCYDALNQLIHRNTGASCSSSAKDESYTYDDAGNRLTAVDASGTRTFTYTSDGQLSGVPHDDAGRILEFGNWRAMAFDAEGRLTEICDLVCSTGSDRYFFTYDADGQRTRVVHSAGGSQGTVSVTELRYSADGHIRAEYVDGVLTREYVTDDAGAIVKMTVPVGQSGAGTYLVSWNGHGDALNLLHLSGGSLAVANSFTYDTWGTATVQLHGNYPNLGFRFRYTGQLGVQDDTVYSLPLLLMGKRHYSTEWGRFLQPDPAALEENHYEYGGNNPVANVDPDGGCWFRFGPGGGRRLMGLGRIVVYGCVRGGGGFGGPSRGGTGAPGRRAFSGRDAPARAYDHLEKNHGIKPWVASNRLHRIKRDNGVPANANVVIGRTGDVYFRGRWIGSLTAGGRGVPRGTSSR